VASGVSLLFAAGHSLGGTKAWSPGGETEMLRAMKAFHMETQGVSRTYFDFYVGFGWTLSVYMLLQAVVLWQLSTIARVDPVRTRPIIGAFTLAAAASTWIAWTFIFAVPALFGAALTLCLGLAFHSARARIP